MTIEDVVFLYALTGCSFIPPNILIFAFCESDFIINIPEKDWDKIIVKRLVLAVLKALFLWPILAIKTIFYGIKRGA